MAMLNNQRVHETLQSCNISPAPCWGHESTSTTGDAHQARAQDIGGAAQQDGLAWSWV
jgi:hypothetical protein